MKLLKKSLLLNYFWALSALNAEGELAKNEKKDKEGLIDFAVGGQAVIEGVMMRSPNHIAIAVRKPDGGIEVQKKVYKTLVQRFKALNLAILRGMINLFEMMIIGTKAINFSASVAMEDETPVKKEDKSKAAQIIEKLMFAVSFVVAMSISIFLFKFLPLFFTSLLEKVVPAIEENYILFNLLDGLFKMGIFLSYIYILTLFEDFRRIFEYHGAEHKSIIAYENKLPLTVENTKKQTRFHPRCGTSFIFIVFTISIILYTFIPKQETFIANLILRVAVLPLIAGISYEYLKLSAKHINNRLVKVMVTPGLWFQRLTTSEPDNSQLEVGIKSLEEALEMEKNI